MLNIDFSQIQPISALPRKYTEIIEQVKKKGIVYFLKGNKPRVALINIDYLEKLEGRIRAQLKKECEEQKIWEDVQKSEEDIKQGRVHKFKSFKNLM
jgi:hypothetical protein